MPRAHLGNWSAWSPGTWCLCGGFSIESVLPKFPSISRLHACDTPHKGKGSPALDLAVPMAPAADFREAPLAANRVSPQLTLQLSCRDNHPAGRASTSLYNHLCDCDFIHYLRQTCPPKPCLEENLLGSYRRSSVGIVARLPHPRRHALVRSTFDADVYMRSRISSEYSVC